jgi:putative FmdB family regulatory protein
MPIYEFYCEPCHTVFQFLSRSVDTTGRPPCPRCGAGPLERRVSVFSISRGLEEPGEGEDGLPDEAALERAMAGLEGEIDSVDEDDPRAMGRVLRKLLGASGLRLKPGMEEAIARMEAGEDPDAIEADLGDAIDDDEPFLPRGKAALGELRRRHLPPDVDPELHEM